MKKSRKPQTTKRLRASNGAGPAPSAKKAPKTVTRPQPDSGAVGGHRQPPVRELVRAPVDVHPVQMPPVFGGGRQDGRNPRPLPISVSIAVVGLVLAWMVSSTTLRVVAILVIAGALFWLISAAPKSKPAAQSLMQRVLDRHLAWLDQRLADLRELREQWQFAGQDPK